MFKNFQFVTNCWFMSALSPERSRKFILWRFWKLWSHPLENVNSVSPIELATSFAFSLIMSSVILMLRPLIIGRELCGELLSLHRKILRSHLSRFLIYHEYLTFCVCLLFQAFWFESKIEILNWKKCFSSSRNAFI